MVEVSGSSPDSPTKFLAKTATEIIDRVAVFVFVFLLAQVFLSLAALYDRPTPLHLASLPTLCVKVTRSPTRQYSAVVIIATTAPSPWLPQKSGSLYGDLRSATEA